jgi:sialate O-acetylesterase
MMPFMLRIRCASLPILASLTVSLLAASPSVADVVLAPYFRDHGVIQRDQPITISGTADPKEAVEVRFGDLIGLGVGTEAGTFAVELPALPAASVPRDLIVRGKNEVTVRDLLVGDVWICAGQSNMEWAIGQLPDRDATASSATDSEIRFFKVPHSVSWTPKSTSDGAWTIAQGDAVKGCTAIGYFFARELRATQKVPIGLFDCSWGGTKIEPWIPLEALRRDTEHFAEYSAARKRPELAEQPANDSPTVMWNAMVAPFTNVRVKGIAWYQGESNAHAAARYRRSLALLIDEWRTRFQDEKLPFGVFQLASFMQYRADLPVESGWADLRESQRGAALGKQAGLVVLLDIGDANDIHPVRKAEAGRRLGLWARANVYGEKVEFSGPTLRAAAMRGKDVVLSFDHAKGLATRDGKPLGGFAVAAVDGKFVWAKARIEGEEVIVSSEEISHPTQVRYAWHNNPEAANLVNGEGLPAGPFRADPSTEASTEPATEKGEKGAKR